MERLRQLVGRHDLAFSWVLALVIISVAANQFVATASGVFSPWKGGGFGMYTTPHGIHSRATFLIVDGQALRLSPPDPAFADWIASVDPASAGYLKRLQADAAQMRPQPTVAAADRLMAAATRVVWDKAAFGGRADPGRQPASAMRVSVMELARRPSVGAFEIREVFSHAGE